MKRLDDIRSAMLESEILTTEQATYIKGGSSDATEDEKRKPRPGGGISTHKPTIVR